MPSWSVEVQAAGSRFPRGGFACEVHSVFERAVNLRAVGEPYLLSLVASPRLLHPRAALVAWRDFSGLTEVGGFAADPGPETMPRLDLGDPLVRERLDQARFALEALGSGRRLFATEPFGPALRDAAYRLADGLEAGAKGLLGLGLGLTPTGDDFLVGYLAAQACLGELDAGALRPLLERTNEVSAAFLASAAEGRFSAALVALARALTATAPEGAVVHALDTLRTLGHTSGTDAASGLVYGLWDPEHRRRSA